MKKIISIIIVCTMAIVLLGACSVNINGDKLSFDGNVSYIDGTYLTEEENFAQSGDGVKTLDIVNSAGNISITRSESKDVIVKITKKVKGTDEKAKREVMDNIKLKMDKSGEKLSLSARSGEEQGSFIWEWASRLYKSVNVVIDYEIKVPEGVKIYKVDNNAGNTAFENIAGEINVKQNAGEIKLAGVGLEGHNSFNMDAGNINMEASLDNADEVKINGTAGNINIIIPSSSKIDLETGLTAGSLTGSFLSGTSIMSGKFKQKINGGGTRLLVTLAAGNVIIDGK